MFFDVEVEKRRGEARVVCRFTAEAGLTALVGRSGAGKTSVLDMIAGLLTPDRGHVRVGGVTLFDADRSIDVPAQRRCTGYVFQEPRLFPHRTVRANLTYGRRIIPTARQQFGCAVPPISVDEIADLLDITPLLDRRPRTLSGGEAQRVAIGRALLSDPAFLLLDEPLSSLDPERREAAARLIETVRDRLRLPILLVTHDARDAERLAAQVVEMGG